VQALEKSFDAAGQVAAALRRNIIDITHRNLNLGFELAKSLAAARNLYEILETSMRSLSCRQPIGESNSMPSPPKPMKFTFGFSSLCGQAQDGPALFRIHQPRARKEGASSYPRGAEKEGKPSSARSRRVAEARHRHTCEATSRRADRSSACRKTNYDAKKECSRRRAYWAKSSDRYQIWHA
jgi:hypothetical protein